MAASPLTKPRAGSIQTVRRALRPLAAGAKVFKGSTAVCKNGFFQVASGDPAEVAVGYFVRNADNTTGGAGAVSAEIDFERERLCRLFDNDSTAPVVNAGREQVCSLLDDHTVTLFDNTKSSQHVVYDVTIEGVWAEMAFPSSPADSALPRIQFGSTTLIAGTKTVTGVTLSANSKIIVSLKDAGAGAITGFAAFDSPAASRTSTQFVIDALNDSKAVITTAVCVVDYLIVG